jgi:hypothetical protein
VASPKASTQVLCNHPFLKPAIALEKKTGGRVPELESSQATLYPISRRHNLRYSEGENGAPNCRAA